MNPVSKKIVAEDGRVLTQLTLDPMAFVFNSFALGDVIANVPVIKYMVDRYFTDPSMYKVVAKQHFRCLFPFVPDGSFVDFDDNSKPLWGIPKGVAVATMNKKAEGVFVRNTPKHMLLGQFGSFMLADRIIDAADLNYVPLNPVEVSHFNLDLPKCVVLITSYRDYTRSWPGDEILQTARWLTDTGYTPVFVGKTEQDVGLKASAQPKSALPDDISQYGVDLRNKTSIPELASLMGQSAAVCGIDCGPVHLAGTTSVPIVCGYTSVSPEYRIPLRKEGRTYAIVPELPCIGCESRWHTSYHNFENCYIKTAPCVDHLTAKRFTDILETFL